MSASTPRPQSPEWPQTPGVHRLAAPLIDALLHWAAQTHRPVRCIDLGGARSKADLMACLAAGLRLPDYFGGNLDALHDCLTDPDHAPQDDVVLTGLHDVPGLSAQSLIEVFEEAVLARGEAGAGFRVYWSAAA
jgi:RNAse (barnase) inhibitor barstar